MLDWQKMSALSSELSHRLHLHHHCAPLDGGSRAEAFLGGALLQGGACPLGDPKLSPYFLALDSSIMQTGENHQ